MFKAINQLLFPMENICLMCKERGIDTKDFICKNCYDNLEIIDREICINLPYINPLYTIDL